MKRAYNRETRMYHNFPGWRSKDIPSHKVHEIGKLQNTCHLNCLHTSRSIFVSFEFCLLERIYAFRQNSFFSPVVLRIVDCKHALCAKREVFKISHLRPSRFRLSSAASICSRPYLPIVHSPVMTIVSSEGLKLSHWESFGPAIFLVEQIASLSRNALSLGDRQ